MQETVKRLLQGIVPKYKDEFNQNLSVLTKFADDYVKEVYEVNSPYPQYDLSEKAFKVIICRATIDVADYIDWIYHNAQTIESLSEKEISYMIFRIACEEYAFDINGNEKEFLVAFGFCRYLEAKLIQHKRDTQKKMNTDGANENEKISVVDYSDFDDTK